MYTVRNPSSAMNGSRVGVGVGTRGVSVALSLEVGLASKVCERKVEVDDSAVLFTFIVLIVGVKLLAAGGFPQAINKMMITEDMIDTRFEILVRNGISPSKNKFRST